MAITQPGQMNGTSEAPNTHDNATNGTSPANGTSSNYLRVLIVGAGIGGLTAAIALRQQGHEVSLFEQSRFASESGAAIHLAPNSNGVLRRLGIFSEEFGANPMEHITEYSAEGKVTRSIDLREPNKMWQHPWLLAHRVHLHDALKLAATGSTGKGKPAQLHTTSKVVDIDEKTPSITLENGKVIEGDLLLGADGVHSITRTHVPGGHVKPFGSGKSAFRFMISRQEAQDDPRTRRFVETPGDLIIWYGEDRRLVVYPTSNNKLLNFVCIHPESESDGGDDWNKGVSREKLIEVYKGFEPDVLALLSKANPESLKVWKLLDMEPLPTFVHEHLALLGDAAHPFLPHQGQGAGCAIEDAAALGVIFPAGTPREEIPDRLKLYDQVRYERAHRIQEFTRLAGADLKDNVKMDMMAYTNYNFGHDETDNSTQALRKWTWARCPALYWRMPIAFGPMPGPRQNTLGVVRQATESTFTTVSIKFATSRTLLQNLFPSHSSSYSFSSPGTVAYASFSQTTLNKMEWLGGSGYSHLGLYIHGVSYTKADGSKVSGTYMPLLFESLTDPIVSGREELGMPKLYSAIQVSRRASSVRINTSWEGAHWGSFTLSDLTPQDAQSDGGTISGEPDAGILVHRYIPAVGRTMKGKAEADYPVFVPYADDFPTPKPQRVWKAGKAEFKIDGLDWEALPTLHHVIGRLAELPVYEVVGGKVVEGTGVPDVGAAHRVE